MAKKPDTRSEDVKRITRSKLYKEIEKDLRDQLEANGTYDIDICATAEEQARTSFDDIYNILENPAQTKKLKRFFYWNKEVITGRKNKSKIKYRTNNAKSKDGLRSGKVDFDEVHAYENYDNIKVFTTALGKKPHPRRTYITTNGDVCDGVLDDLIEKAKRILDGETKDNGFLPFICMIDDEKEVHDDDYMLQIIFHADNMLCMTTCFQTL